MEYLTRNIRNLLGTVLNDEEQEIFCFDNFVPVYKKFTRGQSQTSRIQTLIAYAEQHGLFDTLLREVEQINPARYPEFMPYVKTEGVPEGSIGLIQSACEKAPVATESGAARFRVSIIPPNHPARIYLVFTTGRVTFGGPKDTQADVVIRSPGVKTGHGRIVNENGSFYLHGCESVCCFGLTRLSFFDTDFTDLHGCESVCCCGLTRPSALQRKCNPDGRSGFQHTAIRPTPLSRRDS